MREARAEVVLVQGEGEVASWPLWVEGGLELSVVDRLARLQLAAGHSGCSIRLRHACPHLLSLLDLVGLADVMLADVAPTDALGQVAGEAEDGEEGGGVEEVVVPDDPVA